MIKGNINTGSLTINLRNMPVADTNDKSTIVGSIKAGQTFVGSVYEKDTLGRNWIKLSFVNGSPVSGMYLASWISSVKITENNPEVPNEEEIIGTPTSITTIEEFLENGSIKTRTTKWVNPQVIGE